MIKIKEFITRQREFEKSDYAFAKKLGITPQRLQHYLKQDIDYVSKKLVDKIWQEYQVEIYSENKSRIKVAKISIDTNEVLQVYESMSEASKENNTPLGNISNCLKNKLKSTGGFKWEKIDE